MSSPAGRTDHDAARAARAGSRATGGWRRTWPRRRCTVPAPRPARECRHDPAEPPPITPSGRAMALSVVLLAALSALTLAGERSGQRADDAMLVLDIAAGVAGCAVIAFASRAPVAVATGLGALGALSATATPLAGTALLWLASRTRLPVAAAVGAAAVSGQALRGLWRPVVMPLGWWLLFQLAVFSAIVGWGAMVRARRAVIASLRERARRAEADQARREADARRQERTRIAREMHDVLAHRLSLLATFAGAVEYHPDAPPEQLARAAAEIRSGAHQALEELREVIGVLRADGGDRTAIERPQPAMTDIPRLIRESRDAGMTVEVDDGVAGREVPDGAARTAYRVVQEALTNARRHAAGQPVRVVLAGAPGRDLVIEVSNPIAAPAAEQPPTPGADSGVTPGAGSGIVGLRERVTLAGGELAHGVSADGRFRVRASLPWRP